MAIHLVTNRLTVGTINAPGGGGFGTNHARIGYENFVPDSVVTGSSEQTDWPASAVKNLLTYDGWKPLSMNADIVIDMQSNKAVDYIGLAAHTLGSNSVSIVASYSLNGSSYTDLGVSQLPSTDRAIMLMFEQVTARYIKIEFIGASTFKLGVVYVGAALEMYRPFYGGHMPGPLNRKTTVKPNKSVGGQWLGRSIIREGVSSEFKWQHTPIDWYQTNVDPFAIHAREKPFFIVWNPRDYPEHAMYAWTSSTIAPTFMGLRDYVEFGFSVEGVE